MILEICMQIHSMVFALSRQFTSKNYAKTVNPFCAGNKVFVKYQAQGRVLIPNPPTLAYALAHGNSVCNIKFAKHGCKNWFSRKRHIFNKNVLYSANVCVVFQTLSSTNICGAFKASAAAYIKKYIVCSRSKIFIKTKRNSWTLKTLKGTFNSVLLRLCVLCHITFILSLHLSCAPVLPGPQRRNMPNCVAEYAIVWHQVIRRTTDVTYMCNRHLSDWLVKLVTCAQLLCMSQSGPWVQLSFILRASSSILKNSRLWLAARNSWA